MTKTRREFLEGAGAAAASAALISKLPYTARADSRTSDFDINRSFDAFMQGIGGSAADGGGDVKFIGQDPLLRSHFRIGSSMAIPAMAAGVGAAAIWKDRTGEGQDVQVDLRESIYNVNPIIALVLNHEQAVGLIPADDPIPSSLTFVPGINGGWYQAPWGLGNPFSFQLFRTKDGRFVTITGVYPHLYDRALELLSVPPDRDAITKAIAQWESAKLDEAMAEARVIGGVHRTADEWLNHPEGKYLASRPVIDIVKIGDADPPPYSEDPEQPLSGIKCLALTHVIAGSCAARTLAENGAEVLHIARDQSFEHPVVWTDVNVGMRSSFMNLRKPEQAQILSGLVKDADVFIESFGGRSIENLGFGVEEVAAMKPGIVYLSVRCYGWDGPWRDRGGFDMEALTVSGYTMAEGAGGLPKFSPNFPVPEEMIKDPAFPPTLVLNDYIAGYLGAAGVIAALRRRAKEGGSYHVRISLTRAAMWYQGLGTFPTTDFDATKPEHRMIAPESLSGQTCYGEIKRLAPQAKLSRTPGRWRDPLVIVRGGDLPVWVGDR
jgi:crotonobetainyl-CoA:carnitine CoA-transferase CaiB-like acyl-CoA transferase